MEILSKGQKMGELANNPEQKIHEKLIDGIKRILSPFSNKLLIEKQNGVGLIQVFSEEEMIEGNRNRFKIAFSDMLLLDDNNKPFLVIEPESSSSPKTFGRSIPIYSIAKKIIIADKEYPIECPLLLMIVIPNYENQSQKRQQVEDLQQKIKKAMKFTESQLKDFAICQIDDFTTTLKDLLIKNGYPNYGKLL